MTTTVDLARLLRQFTLSAVGGIVYLYIVVCMIYI
jgi:hypothetical protein